MAKHSSVFSRVKESNDIDIGNGLTIVNCECDGIRRHCYLEEHLFFGLGDDNPSWGRQIRIISDFLSKTDYELSLTVYYSTDDGIVESKSSGYRFVDVDSIVLPNGHIERLNASLMNLYRIFDEKTISFITIPILMSIYASDFNESTAMINSLVDFGYLSRVDGSSYIISKDGWKYIAEVEKANRDRTGFIAISFREETEPIISALKKGIERAHFEPIVIKDVEHNNQIVPEIRRHIERCSFLVMDCTHPNLGAYYEAGIAVGLGKEVIICCSEESFNSDDSRPHFDIAQQSMIVWKDLDDLSERLTKRIKATVKTRFY